MLSTRYCSGDAQNRLPHAVNVYGVRRGDGLLNRAAVVRAEYALPTRGVTHPDDRYSVEMRHLTQRHVDLGSAVRIVVREHRHVVAEAGLPRR